MEITEKVAYLKGLMEGLEMDKSTKEGKVLTAMLDILDDMAYAVNDLNAGMAMMAEQMDMLDEDLCEMQEDLYGDECTCHDHCDDEDDDDFDSYEGELYEVTCPACGDTVCVDEDMLDEGEIPCPGCGELLEFDLEGDIDEEADE